MPRRNASERGQWLRRTGTRARAGSDALPPEGTGADHLDGEQFVTFVEALPAGVMILDLPDPADPRSLRVRAMNPAMRRFLPVRPERIRGEPLVSAFPERRVGVPGVDRLVRRIARAATEGSGFEVELDVDVHLTGDALTVELRAVPLPGRSVAVLVEDVTARVRAEQALAHRSSHDPLTGLVNRAELLDSVERAITHRDGRAVTLLVIDLDRFKDVNDTFGHDRGDELLQLVAGRIEGAAPPGSVVARLGGDEFAVLLPAGTTVADGVAAALAIEAGLAVPATVGSWVQLEVAASTGIACVPDHASDASSLVVRADMAMHAAKRSSTGGHAVYTPNLDRSSVRRMVLLGDLRRALASGELVLHFQPIVDAASRRPAALEGLVRWHHPDLGIVMPSEFIELVEMGSLSRPLALAVVRQALQQLRTCRALGHPELGININLTPRNLGDRELVDTLVQLVRDEEVPTGLLTIELTERQLVDDLDEGLAALAQLHEAGVRVAIDDFGTGASSLWLLRRLAVDELKIDRSFIADLRAGEDAVVRSVIELGHSLGMVVVAEGVEDDLTQQLLADLGCDLLQGYGIGRAVGPEGVVQLLGGVKESVQMTTQGVGPTGR
jgi:diguanylate cyclase (GGDEF)-like protein